MPARHAHLDREEIFTRLGLLPLVSMVVLRRLVRRRLPCTSHNIFFLLKLSCRMSPSEQFTVLDITSISVFINYLLQHHKPPTILVVCSTREAFLQDLLQDCHDSDQVTSPTVELHHSASRTHPLLIPTIHLLAMSQTIKVAFVPTISHLRVYLATCSSKESKGGASTTYVKPGFAQPILALLNPLKLHHSTGEFSAQGLSRTFALAAEAAALLKVNLIVAETLVNGTDEDRDVGNGETTSPRSPWNEEVPILNSSIRSGSGDRAWAGRTVELRQVAERWFTFERVLQGGPIG